MAVLSLLIASPSASASSTILGTTGIGPHAITIDGAGNIYTANEDSNNVTKITPAGVSSILGTTGILPVAITIDSVGNIYTANEDTNDVNEITPAGESSILGTTSLDPHAITIDGAGNIYTANFDSNNVTKITPEGVSSILGTTGNGPIAITIDSAGNIYTANHLSNNVSKITQVPAFTLSHSYETATAGSPITGYSITSTGGAIASYAITPAIGNGLSFSTSTGLISGTPSAAAGPVIYTITGTNFFGSAAATYALTVSAAPVIPVIISDPVQQSTITSITPASAPADLPTQIVISGKFIESIVGIEINSRPLSSGSWIQTPTSLSFTMPSKSPGRYFIQLFNGSVPLLTEQRVTITPTPIPYPTPTVPIAVQPKVIYIHCVNPIHGTRIAYGVNPMCPHGYVKK